MRRPWLVVGVVDDGKTGGGLMFVGVFISGCVVTRLTKSIESVVMSIELVTSSSLLLLKTAAAVSSLPRRNLPWFCVTTRHCH